MIIRELLLLALIYVPAFLIELISLIPAGLSSMGLFFILLQTNILKVSQFQHIVPMFLAHIALFFIAPAVNILAATELLKPIALQLILLLVLSNFLVLAVTGVVVQKVMNKEKQHG